MKLLSSKRKLVAALGVAVVGAAASVVTVGLVTPAHAAETVQAHVVGTGGEQLYIRSGPGTGHGIIGALNEGDYVDISCQVDGESIYGNVVWDYLPAFGGFSSDYYLYTGYDGRHPNLPECSQAPPPGTDLRDRIVEIAKGELGKTDGSYYHPDYGHPSDEWCQYFVNWVWGNAGVPNMFRENGFTGSFYWWGVNRGLATDGPYGAEVGDAVLFGTGPSDPSTSRHVGIVVAVHGDGSIETVDGNYADRVAWVGPYYPDNATTHEPGNVYAIISPE